MAFDKAPSRNRDFFYCVDGFLCGLCAVLGGFFRLFLVLPLDTLFVIEAGKRIFL